MTELHPDAEALIKRFEGCRLQAYDDATGKPLAAGAKPVGIPTIGWGRTRGVRPGMVCTQAQADRWFDEEANRVADAVLDACRREPNDHQLGAMVSLAYNIGMGWPGAKRPPGARKGFRQSTVLRAFNRGDDASAARAFALWNKSRGRENAGLVRRRKAESQLYLRPVGDTPEEPTPQTVDPESSLTRSPIAIGSATVSVASAGSLLATARDAAENLGGIRDGLGDWLPYALIVLLAVGVVAGLVILWNRWRQRNEGWA